MKIKIPKGHIFREGLNIDFSGKGLVVITGLNGSGKTSVLSHLYRAEKEKNPSSVFFKTTNITSYNEIKKYTGLSRYRDSRGRFHDKEILTIEEIWEEIYRSFINFCRKNKIHYGDQYDAVNMLFNKDHELYEEYGSSFLYEVSYLISESTGTSILAVNKQLGIPSGEEIKKLAKIKIRDILSPDKKKKIHQSNKEYKSLAAKYDAGFGVGAREDYVPKYRNYSGDSSEKISLQKIDEESRKELEVSSRKKAKVKTKIGFDEYVYELINPIQSMEAIIDKLARKIDDQKNEKVKIKYWQQINEEIESLNKEFGEKKFTYLLNPPSPRTKYDITFYSEKKEPDSEYIPFHNLSSGEKVIFELICYYFVSCKDEASKDMVSLIILDEFDANLNPALAELYLKTVNKEFVQNDIKVILTTHSPSTVAEVKPENLFELINDEKGHRIECAKNEDGKKKILEKLAPKFVYDEELGPLGAIKGSKDVIIFVEGKDDDEFFPEKAKELGLDSYKFIPCGGADNIPHIIKALSIIPYFTKIIQNKTIIGLFDFDEKGLSAIHRIKGDKEEIKRQTQNYKNNKEPILHEYRGAYLLTLIPKNDHSSWQDHLNNPYRLEELKNDEKANGKAVDRLFAEIKKIITKARHK